MKKYLAKHKELVVFFLFIALRGGNFIFEAKDNDRNNFSTKKIEYKKLKIGLINDIHARSDSNVNGGRELKGYMQEELTYFAEKMKSEFNVNVIVNNGDVIEGTNISSDKGMMELTEVKKILDKIGSPIYWVLGNHDLRSVDKNQWKESLGIDYTNKSFKINGYKIIILDSNFDIDNSDILPGKYFTRGKISIAQYKWLKGELASVEKKIIFVHHPPLTKTGIKKEGQLLVNAKKFQDLFSQGNVVAVFAGHTEELYNTKIDGVEYFIFPGPEKKRKHPGAFTEIIVDGFDLRVIFYEKNKTGEYVSKKIK